MGEQSFALLIELITILWWSQKEMFFYKEGVMKNFYSGAEALSELRQMGLAGFRRRSFEVAQRLADFIRINRDKIIAWAEEVRPGYLDPNLDVSPYFFESLNGFRSLENIEPVDWTDGVRADVSFDPDSPFSLVVPYKECGENRGRFVKIHFLILLAIEDKIEEADQRFLEIVRDKAKIEEALRWLMDGKWSLNRYGVNFESVEEAVGLITEFKFCVRTDTD